MNKLLSAGFSRMLRDKIFWAGLLAVVAGGIFIPVSNYISMMEDGMETYIDSAFFSVAIYIGIILSVFCSLFIGTEYSDGFIRNKLIVGHKRSAVYFANLITCGAGGVIICVAGLAAYLCAGLPLLGGFHSPVKSILLLVMCSILISMVYASVFTLIGMVSQSKSMTAVLCILLAFLLLFTGMYIYTRLDEPKVFNGIAHMDESGTIVVEENQPNPNYVDGTKRQVYEFVNDFLPGGQALQTASMEVKNPWLLMMYSTVIIVAATGAGVAAFRRKDLK